VCMYAESRPMRACRRCDASLEWLNLYLGTIQASVCVYYLHIQHARKHSGLLSCINQTNVTCTCAQYASGAFFGVIFDNENKCICFIVCYFACIKKAISWSTLTKHVRRYILILGYAVSVWLASLAGGPALAMTIANRTRVHCSHTWVSSICIQYVQVWSWMGTYLCLKHMHSVCASAALNEYIFVPQAYAFCVCKCSLDCIHVFFSSICILYVQVCTHFQRYGVSSICIWYVQVLPTMGTHFRRYGVSNICIQYVQVLPSKHAYFPRYGVSNICIWYVQALLAQKPNGPESEN
jgi:hypothetical protein